MRNASLSLYVALFGLFGTGCEDETRVPDSMPRETEVAALASEHGARDAFDLAGEGGRFRVLVFQEDDHDFRLVLYRLESGAYRRLGSELNLVGSEPPRLDGDRVRARQRASGIEVAYQIKEGDFELVIGEGWTPRVP